MWWGEGLFVVRTGLGGEGGRYQLGRRIEVVGERFREDWFTDE